MEEKKIEYQYQDQVFEAHLVYPDNCGKKCPVIFIFHSWVGRNFFVCDKAKAVAKLGYIGCALDLYGKGILGTNIEENKALMEPLLHDRSLLLARIVTGVGAVTKDSLVDSTQIGGMGFCFGGLCALDWARSGVDVKAVVSLHGLLSPPPLLKKNDIKAKILVLHGYADPMVPPEQVHAFQKEMEESCADWQMHIYGRTAHGFTNPDAADPEIGAFYSALAEQRALQATWQFFSESFTV